MDDVGRLAAWRLWRLINDRRNAHGYGGRRSPVAQADHVTRWDHVPTTVAERARLMSTPATPADLHDRQADLREQGRRREAARIAAEAELARQAERAELSGRWGLDRYTPRPQQEPPRRWASREPEAVHEAQMEDRRRLDMPLTRSRNEETYQAALAKARAEKRARRRKS
ncbi:hypothetical protein ACIHFC_35110 [Streptomyces sp. NPDC052013]|uniref:hypothetical protein n=1 Tax=Streptomyces sp. NPDC052013 TaxID=3365679 RepID=UPI0037D259DC